VTTTASRVPDHVRVALLLADLVVAPIVFTGAAVSHLSLSMAPRLADATRGVDLCQNGTIDTVLVRRADGIVLYRGIVCVWYGTRKDMYLLMQSCSEIGTSPHFMSCLCVPSLCW